MTYQASRGRRASDRQRKDLRVARNPTYISGTSFADWWAEQLRDDAVLRQMYEEARTSIGAMDVVCRQFGTCYHGGLTVSEVAAWAYGNAVLSNPDVTREMAMDAARKLLGDK